MALKVSISIIEWYFFPKSVEKLCYIRGGLQKIRGFCYSTYLMMIYTLALRLESFPYDQSWRKISQFFANLPFCFKGTVFDRVEKRNNRAASSRVISDIKYIMRAHWIKLYELTTPWTCFHDRFSKTTMLLLAGSIWLKTPGKNRQNFYLTKQILSWNHSKSVFFGAIFKYK